MHFNNITRLYDSMYARLPCKPGKKAACLREGDYEAGHAITHVQTHVWNAVCNKNPFLFPLQITLLSDFISLFPREIRMSLFPREIRMSLFPREIRNVFISLGNKKYFHRRR